MAFPEQGPGPSREPSRNDGSIGQAAKQMRGGAIAPPLRNRFRLSQGGAGAPPLPHLLLLHDRLPERPACRRAELELRPYPTSYPFTIACLRVRFCHSTDNPSASRLVALVRHRPCRCRPAVATSAILPESPEIEQGQRGTRRHGLERRAKRAQSGRIARAQGIANR